MSGNGGGVRTLDVGGKAAVRAGTAMVRAIGSTWRIRVVGDDVANRFRAAGTPGVFVFWHGQLLPLLWYYRNWGVIVLISEHRDGEIVAQIAQSLGYRVIRGSSSRGGGRALREAASAVSSGGTLAITPDGPRGPARKFAPGALIAAHRAGAALVPVAVSASTAWKLRSWDSFLIPKPFARVRIGYGDPIYLSDQSAQAAALRTVELEQAMAEIEARLWDE